MTDIGRFLAEKLMGWHTGKMPWDDIWDFSFYCKSGVSKRSIVLFERNYFK